jgi:protein TonB
LLIVISAHVALLAAVMSAKMDLPSRIEHEPPLIDIRVPPPPERRDTQLPRGPIEHPARRSVAGPNTVIRTPPLAPAASDLELGGQQGVSAGASASLALPQPLPSATTAPVHHDARLLTPASDLKPPYPASKLASEEEATLRLRLTIDEGGRVIAVDPIGRADSTFLEAARRYILAHWRFDPATEDGRAVPATTIITLRFQLDG